MTKSSDEQEEGILPRKLKHQGPAMPTPFLREMDPMNDQLVSHLTIWPGPSAPHTKNEKDQLSNETFSRSLYVSLIETKEKGKRKRKK